jgi:hypothetical protein
MVENYIDNLSQGRIITEGYFNDWNINNINLTITSNIDSFLFIVNFLNYQTSSVKEEVNCLFKVLCVF